MSKPTLQKIVFNVRGKQLELTPEEAKELKDVLQDLFGETKVIHSHEYIPWRPWSIPWSGTYWCSNPVGQYSLADGATSNGNTMNYAPDSNDTLYLSIK